MQSVCLNGILAAVTTPSRLTIPPIAGSAATAPSGRASAAQSRPNSRSPVSTWPHASAVHRQQSNELGKERHSGDAENLDRAGGIFRFPWGDGQDQNQDNEQSEGERVDRKHD